MEPAAPVLIGDFRIEKRLGSGGMGVVYLARQLSLDRLVALKILGPALNESASIARFRREAQAVARLEHKGIASIYFIGQDGKASFLAMQYIEGSSLRAVLDHLSTRDRPIEAGDLALRAVPVVETESPVVRFDEPTTDLSPLPGATNASSGSPTAEASRATASPAYIRRCCEVAREAAQALAHAHERGVIHRDVKPENILIDGQGRVYLIDFGLARFFEDATLTSTGSLLGTPMYMSPEQVSGRIEVDHRTDVYSLGVVLYELLTLRRPIEASTREGVLRQVATKPLAPLSRKNRSVPVDLESVVHKATSKDPDGRYQSAAELAEDLTRFLDGKPVVAPPYRYLLDPREITAERPRGVELVAIFFLVVAFCCMVLTVGELSSLAVVWSGMGFAPGVGPTIRPRFPEELYLISLILWSTFAVVAVAVGNGLMIGRSWARWFAMLICLIEFGLITATLVGTGYEWRFGRNPAGLQTFIFSLSFIQTAFLLITWDFLCLFSTYQLARREARDWFRLAGRIRAEHKRQASSR